MYDHIDEVLSGGSYSPDIRAKRLKEINEVLKPYGIKLTEDCFITHPVEGNDEITHQDITLYVWTKKRYWFGWDLVAAIVPGEEFPRVKDGRLPEVLSIKKVVTEGEDLPPYFVGYHLGYLLLDGDPIMVISGRRILVTDLGHQVEYYIFQLHYAPMSE